MKEILKLKKNVESKGTNKEMLLQVHEEMLQVFCFIGIPPWIKQNIFVCSGTNKFISFAETVELAIHKWYLWEVSKLR